MEESAIKKEESEKKKEESEKKADSMIKMEKYVIKNAIQNVLQKEPVIKKESVIK
jgi:hypothetical protein